MFSNNKKHLIFYTFIDLILLNMPIIMGFMRIFIFYKFKFNFQIKSVKQDLKEEIDESIQRNKYLSHFKKQNAIISSI